MISMVSTIKSTGLWPCDGGLDSQDSGLVTWYCIIDDFRAKAEYDKIEDMKRESERNG